MRLGSNALPHFFFVMMGSGVRILLAAPYFPTGSGGFSTTAESFFSEGRYEPSSAWFALIVGRECSCPHVRSLQRGCFSALPWRAPKAIDIEEASTEETASVLGIRPQTVKTRLHRARRRLRDALGEQIGSVLKDAFPFERDRCDRLVERLINQVSLPPLNRSQAGAQGR
jgi:Sigma-70, region 4